MTQLESSCIGSELIDLNDYRSGDNRRKVATATLAGGGALAATALVSQPASAQSAETTAAIAEVTAVPGLLGGILTGFVGIAVSVMAVTYAIRIGRRVKP